MVFCATRPTLQESPMARGPTHRPAQQQHAHLGVLAKVAKAAGKVAATALCKPGLAAPAQRGGACVHGELGLDDHAGR